MRRPTALLLCMLALLPAALAGAGCGNDTKTVTGTNASGQTTTRAVPDVKFAKTKFVLHTGLAVGAFRRWIYKPWQAGTLRKGADGRTAALVKAAAAGAFTVHELRLARNAALSDDRLRGVGDKLGSLGSQFQSVIPGLKDGSFSASDIAKLAAGLGGVTALAKTLGIDVKALPVPNPGG